MAWVIEFDAAELSRQFRMRERRIREALPQILEQEGEFVLDMWRAGARGKMYPGMSRPLYSDAYAAAIERTEVTMDATGGEVTIQNTGVTNFGPNANNGRTYDPFDFVRLVENGRGPVDLKDAILGKGTSSRIKHGKNGPYLIIPFRFGSGESLHHKANIGPQMKALAQSGQVSEARARRTNNPWMRAQLEQERPAAYGRGPHTILGIGPRLRRLTGYEWKKPLLAGLRRVGAAGHSQYMTFRTMTMNDPGAWISPAMPPNPIWESTMRVAEPLVRQHVRDAVAALAESRSFWARLRDRF